MALGNSLQKRENKIILATPSNIRTAMSNATMQKQLQAMISEPKKRDQLVSTMISMCQQTRELQNCEVSSVYNAAIAGAALDLPYGFGYFYAVPRANNKIGKQLGFKNGEYKEATFQLGYKGFVQLAMRSGEYRDIDVYEIKEGELAVNKRRITVDDVLYLENHAELETIGYLAFFELHNGFKKSVYMRRSEIVEHAKEYSFFDDNIYRNLKAGKQVQDAWKYSSQWYTDFDMMASKTVLKRLLSRWGILSVEMQTAIKQDQAVIGNGGEVISYPDNPKDDVNSTVSVEEVPNESEVVEPDKKEQPSKDDSIKAINDMF